MQFSYEYFVACLADGANHAFRYRDYYMSVYGWGDEYEFSLFKDEKFLYKRKYKDAYTLLRKTKVEDKFLKEIWYDLQVVE